MRKIGLSLLPLFVILQLGLIACKNYPLEPLSAINIGNFVLEPSGLTFCESTGHLYAICDRHSCDYIYEMDVYGTPVRRLKYDKSKHDDVEAVACYSEEGLLYIAEEEKRRVTVFKLDDYEKHDGEYYLKEVTSFYVEEDGDYVQGSGIEGLTVNTKTGEIYVANEKEPIVLFQLSADYVLQHRSYPKFSGDISDLFYDAELDALWVLSDRSSKVFVTNLDASVIYDSWEIPMKNAEGIAIDNTADPKMMYIVTDPSSPQGAQYVAAFYTFYKPVIGTGIQTGNIPPNPPIVCVGCDEIEEEAQKNQNKFNRANNIRLISEIVGISLSSLAFVGLLGALIAIGFVGYRVVANRRAHASDSDDENSRDPFSITDNDNDLVLEEGKIDHYPSNDHRENFFTRFFSQKKQRDQSDDPFVIPLNDIDQY